MESEVRDGKRKRNEFEDDLPDNLGMGQTIANIRRTSEDNGITSAEKSDPQENGNKDVGHVLQSVENDWQTVDRNSKRRRKNDGNYPAISHAAHARLNQFVKISDLQNLALYLLADGPAPQWVSVRHHKSFAKVVVLMVPGLEADLFDGKIALEEPENQDRSGTIADGENSEENTNGTQENGVESAGQKLKQHRIQKMTISPDDYYPSKLATQKLPGPLKPLFDMFPHMWPIKTPGEYNRMHSPLYAMLSAPIPRAKEEKRGKGPKFPAEGRNWQNQRTPLVEYLSTKEELAENGFAIHPAHLHSEGEVEFEKTRRHKACQSPEDGWVDVLEIKSTAEGAVPESDIEKGSVTGGRRLLVADCEMVTTTVDRFALARVSLIDWDGKTVLDEFVKPPDPVTNYLTQYSGITKEHLDTATLTLKDIQEKLRNLLTPQTILAGHSLDSDFRALKISYPFVIDTALLYPHPKGPPQKSSLKWLTQKYLGREIQNHGAKGHDSVEDALACLDLIKQKCEKGKTWGTPDATGEPIFRRLARQDSDSTDSKAHARTGAVVDWGDPMRGFGASATVAIPCETDADVVAGVKRAVNGSDEHPTIPSGGVDFTWARLRELEALRGWWNRSKSLDAADRLARTLDNSSSGSDGVLSTSDLAQAVSRTVDCIKEIWATLPPKTAFIVYSGSGDPRGLVKMQALHAEFKKAYNTMKWDELPVKWTDAEELAIKDAAKTARSGIGFIGVK